MLDLCHLNIFLFSCNFFIFYVSSSSNAEFVSFEHSFFSCLMSVLSCNAEFVSFEHSSFSCLMSISHVMVPTEHYSVFCWYVLCVVFSLDRVDSF